MSVEAGSRVVEAGGAVEARAKVRRYLNVVTTCKHETSYPYSQAYPYAPDSWNSSEERMLTAHRTILLNTHI